MPRSDSDSRSQILDAAQQMILRQGFAASSIDAIVREASLTKGAFFHHFRSKHDLALVLLERFAASDAALLEETMARAERLHRDPLQQLLLFFGLYQEMVEGDGDPLQGCLFASYVYEMQLFEDEVHELIRKVALHWRDRVGGKLREAAVAHPPAADVSLDDLADMLTVVFEGAYVMGRMTREPRMMPRQVHLLRVFVEMLFGVEVAAAPAPAARSA